ncbi:hypothetical protein [Shewanella sp. NKUCC06_TVS]|uniref:hypothetical protein n=1 Tax=Shewanella sp. NKUCC06_TVS TaxID=2842128 RepID=UPI001C5B12C2|nr:hypothetical protein [Shewanella sp. NKUCC06_TVS]MBW3532307.1 hypothetical protein [Shewanella sp. NKUCC06_TVS]
MAFPSGADQSESIEIAKEYLMDVKGWKCGEFIVHIDHYELMEPSNEYVSIRATHKDDLLNSTPGGGKSVQLRVSIDKQKVIRELGYQ